MQGSDVRYFVIIDSLADDFFGVGTARRHVFVVRLLLLSH